MAAPVSTLQRLAQIVGIVLILVGILGFFNNPVLGIFPVNTLHSIFHLVSGLIFAYVGFSGSHMAAANTFRTFGIIYLLLVILQLAAPDLTGQLLNANSAADLWLHVILAVVFLGLGYGMAGDRSGAARRA